MSEHSKHLAMAAGHFVKLAAHHAAMAQVHKDMAQAYFGDEKAAEHHMHGQRMAALHKSFAAHHLSMVAHSREMAKALREDGGEPNVDEMTQDNVPAMGSDDFEDAAVGSFEKDFALAVPAKFSAVGTMDNPRKVPSKLVYRAGQEELFADFGKVSASDESTELPGFPNFERAD
jgi:hypothetical protein